VDPAVRELWDAWKPGYDLSLSAPDKAKVGAEVTVTATIAHARAGHLVPTGDPERHLMVDLEVLSGDTLIRASEHRIGQRWEWRPVAKKVGDNRLKPGETRDYALSFQMPDGPVQVRARVTHVRLTQDNMRYHVDLFERDGKHSLAKALKALPLSSERIRVQRTINRR